MPRDAYLDIETTGLSCQWAEITVIGLYLRANGRSRIIQLVGKDATQENLLGALEGIKSIYTYNGRRFDLPFIHGTLGIDLDCLYAHTDLMYSCWDCNLYGGFKSVERQLGIPRKLKDISGWDAVRLWRSYRKGNTEALATLLEYNKEDVINLEVLRQKLGVQTR